MSSVKITISLASDVLERLDGLVKRQVFVSRSQAIELAIEEKLRRLTDSRLARECAKLDPHEEQSLAEIGLRPRPFKVEPFDMGSYPHINYDKVSALLDEEGDFYASPNESTST